MARIRTGDQVIVITGKNKGARGVVIAMLEDKCVIEGVNAVKKHVRPNPIKGVAGGIVDKNMPIHLSNVALYNPSTGKADRIGYRVQENGRKVRFFKSDGQLVNP